MTSNLKALVQKWTEQNGLVSRIRRLIEVEAPCKCGEPSEFPGYTIKQCTRCAAVMLLGELKDELAREIERMESEPRAQECDMCGGNGRLIQAAEDGNPENETSEPCPLCGYPPEPSK